MSDYTRDEQVAIGRRISRRIEALGLVRADVAKNAQLAYGTLKLIIDGKSYPKGNQVIRLCKAIEMTPNYMLFGTENPKVLKGSDSEGRMKTFISMFLHFKHLDDDDILVIERLVRSFAEDKASDSELKETKGLIDIGALLFTEEIMNKFQDNPLEAAKGIESILQSKLPAKDK